MLHLESVGSETLCIQQAENEQSLHVQTLMCEHVAKHAVMLVCRLLLKTDPVHIMCIMQRQQWAMQLLL